ncbi:MAG: hypothetical protein ACTHLZ_02515, partial [Tepidisphaeraceae bacterium]
QCLSNLRQFAIGLRMYADSNHGELVEPYLNKGINAYPQTGTTTINTGTSYNPTKTTLYHIGRLWQQKYLNTGRIAYCPANYDAPLFGWNAVGATWPDATSVPGATAVRSDYIYNPHWRYQNGTINRGYYRHLNDMPATRMLAADLFRSQAYTAHKGRGTRPSWNIVFPDGHAVTVVSIDVWKVMGKHEYTNSSSEWPYLENERDMLETLAAGQPLMSNPMGYGGSDFSTNARVYHSKGETGCGTGTLDGRRASYP